jgi:hypothetical protein
MSSTTLTLQTISITTSLLSAGGIATLSIFDLPIIQSQPASRSLPSIRWLFSRGSHIFPTTAIIASTSFLYLSYTSLPLTASSSTISQILSNLTTNSKFTGYLFASILSFSIAPYTSLIMIPTNFTLIDKNEVLGGAKSQYSSLPENREYKPGERSAEDSVNAKGDRASQWTDVSGPMEKTDLEGSEKDEREVGELLEKFKVLNWGRAVLMAAGGVVGLVTALR